MRQGYELVEPSARVIVSGGKRSDEHFYWADVSTQRMKNCRCLAVALSAVLIAFAVTIAASAQENYEIQVYGSDLVDPGRTAAELHSNFISAMDASLETFDPVQDLVPVHSLEAHLGKPIAYPRCARPRCG